jgi:type IX secretion system PorP/SprF family membrane protein
MKRTFTLSVILFLLCFSAINGQTPGPFYRQYFVNPYLFNPAFVAINNTLEANLVYRQQWTNFKDAPVTAGFNVQLPANDRVALGFNVFTDKQVLLRNSNFMATFGYVVPLATNQSLRFGISGGVGINKLDLTAEELNTNDPAIINASGNNFYVDGNFGVAYTNGGLRVGFALTDIFKSNTFNAENFNQFELSNLRNRLYSVSYRFSVGVMENISIEPYFLYRQTEDGLQDAWEAASLIYFKDHFWTGGSYNQNNGLALFLGVNLKSKFRFSYSYEFPPFSSGFSSGSSHELHLGVRFSKKKSKPAVIPKSDPVNVQSAKTVTPEGNTPHQPETGNKNPGRFVVGEEPQPKDMETPIILNETERTKADPIPPIKEEEIKKDEAKTEKPKTPTAKPRESFTMASGHHYVVIGVFGVMSHSMKFTKEMMSKGYAVNVALNPKNNLYYVYIQSTLDLEEAKRIRNEYKWKNLFKEAWIYTME